MVMLPPSTSGLLHRRWLRSEESVWLPHKYSCPDCDNSFDIRASLVRHRIYECEGTNKTLGRKAPVTTAEKKKQQQQTIRKKLTRSNVQQQNNQQQNPQQQSAQQQSLQQLQKQRQGQRRAEKKRDRKRNYGIIRTSVQQSKTHLSNNDQFQCHQCRRTYSLRQNLTKHMNYECGGQKHFCCQFCSGRFTQKASLFRHLLKQHDFDARSHEFTQQ